MCEIKDAQLDIDQPCLNVQECTFKKYLHYLKSHNKKIHKVNQKVVNLFSNLICVTHSSRNTHMPPIIDLPSNNFGSNELLNDQIEQTKNIQPNDNML